MSFYGNVKRINSSPFVFDRIYPNREAMDSACEDGKDDGVYIGRYVLVKYTAVESSPEIDIGITSTTIKNISYINKYSTTTINGVTEKVISEQYEANAQTDINKYGDTFDSTVWQKVYTNINNLTNSNETNESPRVQYILIAELNAAVPRFNLNLINPKHQNQDGTEEWNISSINQELTTEDVYAFNIPNTLKLNVGQISDDFYAKSLIEDPSTRQVITENDVTLTREQMLDSTHNYLAWKNYLNNQEVNQNIDSDIDEKRLDTKFYAFGQLISDIYDIMYGVPSSGTGLRPFYTGTTDIEAILSNYDKGLIGILTSIAGEAHGDASKDLAERTFQPGLTYYFASKWADAQVSPNNFIENIPEVISARADGFEKGHYYIDFSKTSDYVTRYGS